VPAGGNAQYYVEDLLGSSRVMTSANGTVCYDADFDPFGGEHAYTNTCAQNVYKFEGKERDAETGNDDFGARYYSNRFGRWLSADWSSVPAPVPYANLTNPQTLNLYAMVSDDPESFADLDGHLADPQNGTQTSPASCPKDGVSTSSSPNCTGVTPSAPVLQAQAAQNQAAQADDQVAQAQQAYAQKIQAAKDAQNAPIGEADIANALVQAGKTGQTGVNLGLAVTGGELLIAGGVIAAPAVAAATAPTITSVSTTVTNASISAYVTTTSAVATASTVIGNVASRAQTALTNAAASANTAVLRAGVWADNLKPGGGAINAARDFIQAATSSRTPPAPNNYGLAGFAVKVAIKVLDKYF